MNATCWTNVKCPVDGQWSSWQQYKSYSCSVTCASGWRRVDYRRSCRNPRPQFGGKNCPGNNFKTITTTCGTNVHCPIHGRWSSWIQYRNYSCSVTCEKGWQIVGLRRRCNNPKPKYGGTLCPGRRDKTMRKTCIINIKCPVHGSWGLWQQFKYHQCSVTCASGWRRIDYRRHCSNPTPQFGGRNCIGNDFKTINITCGTNITCPVHGGWGTWEQYRNHPCSVTCASGWLNVDYRRKCSNPKPQLGGRSCRGESSKTVNATCQANINCPVDGGWGAWEIHRRYRCSVTCASGWHNVKYRRSCNNPRPQFGGKHCSGDAFQVMNTTCETNVNCPVNGAWSSWEQYRKYPCSVTCASGWRNVKYKRNCNNPEPKYGGRFCQGNGSKTISTVCDTHTKCPVHGAWGIWEQYKEFSCSVTCASGTRVLKFRRRCNNPEPKYGGRNCAGDGSKTILRNCDTHINCPVHGRWSMWEEFSNYSCSVTCASGWHRVDYRRNCSNPRPQFGGRNCIGTDFKTVNSTCDTNVHCPINGGWGAWDQHKYHSCSVTCGIGQRKIDFRRFCNNPIPKYGGTLCSGNRLKTINRTCETNIKCPVDGEWGSWHAVTIGACSVTCGSGWHITEYTRFCNKTKPQFGGKKCPGENHKTANSSCKSNVMCPGDGYWGSWQLVSSHPCSVTCGRGRILKYYSRLCDRPKPRYGGRDCTGNSSRTINISCEANVLCPVDGGWTSWTANVYGPCSATCRGRGKQDYIFKRTCSNPKPAFGGKPCSGSATKTHVQDCTSTDACPGDGTWSTWILQRRYPCSVTCGDGRLLTDYRRHCIHPRRGRTCLGVNFKTANVTCEINVTCPVDGGWSSWIPIEFSVCTVTCNGSGIREITSRRECSNPKPDFGGKNCFGDDIKNVAEGCNFTQSCPVDGGWASWKQMEVSPCSVTCGGVGSSKILFRRQCTNPEPAFGGKVCVGDRKKNFTESCNSRTNCPEAKNPSNMAVLSGIPAAVVVCCVVSGFVLHIRKKKKRKQGRILGVKGKDKKGGGEADNPAFEDLHEKYGFIYVGPTSSSTIKPASRTSSKTEDIHVKYGSVYLGPAISGLIDIPLRKSDQPAVTPRTSTAGSQSALKDLHEKHGSVYLGPKISGSKDLPKRTSDKSPQQSSTSGAEKMETEDDLDERFGAVYLGPKKSSSKDIKKTTSDKLSRPSSSIATEKQETEDDIDERFGSVYLGPKKSTSKDIQKTTSDKLSRGSSPSGTENDLDEKFGSVYVGPQTSSTRDLSKTS